MKKKKKKLIIIKKYEKSTIKLKLIIKNDLLPKQVNFSNFLLILLFFKKFNIFLNK